MHDVTGTCGKTCVEQRPKMCGPKKCRKRQVVVAENKIGTKYLEFEAFESFVVNCNGAFRFLSLIITHLFVVELLR